MAEHWIYSIFRDVHWGQTIRCGSLADFQTEFIVYEVRNLILIDPRFGMQAAPIYAN